MISAPRVKLRNAAVQWQGLPLDSYSRYSIINSNLFEYKRQTQQLEERVSEGVLHVHVW